MNVFRQILHGLYDQNDGKPPCPTQLLSEEATLFITRWQLYIKTEEKLTIKETKLRKCRKYFL